MSLRTRLTVAVAVLVAAAIAVTGWIVVRSAEEELRQEVDAFLIARAERLAPFDLLARAAGRGPLEEGRGRFGEGRFSEDDAIAQIITADGRVINLTDTPIPVSTQDLDIASAGRGRSAIDTKTIDGVDHRVLTVSVGNDLAVVVARDLSEVTTALEGLTRRTVVLGLVGAAIAAVIAWLTATRLSKPVHDLTMAAEHVARTQDLSHSLEVSGDDEVGRLGTSFNTMLGALDTSRQQQQRLVEDAGHELRTPLTSLRTNIDLLRRAQSISADERNEVLGDVSRELDELSTLVAELVELSSSTRRSSEVIELVELGEIAEAVADRARRRFGRTVEVFTVTPEEFRGHRSLIERAVWNLVDNAAKFSPEDTPIDISVDGSRLEVRDRGPGIPAEDRDLVFDRFFRSISTRTSPGSGLGLSIVADIVETHGGSCFVSQPDDGPGVVVGFELVGA